MSYNPQEMSNLIKKASQNGPIKCTGKNFYDSFHYENGKLVLKFLDINGKEHKID